MSRSGMSEGDIDDYLEYGRWRGIVASAVRGKRGQKFFRDLITALDAMPEKKLVEGDLENEEGAVCALGALGKYRGMNLEEIDTYDHSTLGYKFDIASQLTQEVMYENDECGADTDEERWEYVRSWAESQLRKDAEANAGYKPNPVTGD